MLHNGVRNRFLTNSRNPFTDPQLGDMLICSHMNNCLSCAPKALHWALPSPLEQTTLPLYIILETCNPHKNFGLLSFGPQPKCILPLTLSLGVYLGNATPCCNQGSKAIFFLGLSVHSEHGYPLLGPTSGRSRHLSL